MKSRPLLKRFQTNFDSIWDIINSRSDDAVFKVDLGFYKWLGTRKEFFDSGAKREMRVAVVAHLKSLGYDVELHGDKEKQKAARKKPRA